MSEGKAFEQKLSAPPGPARPAKASGFRAKEGLTMSRVTHMRQVSVPPSLEDIEGLAREAMAGIPPELRQYARDVVVKVEEFPDDHTMEEMDLESPFDLLGLYRGVPLTERGASDPMGEPDMIHLYRRPILDYWCETEEDLVRLVRHVLIHEIGHHFGFSDDDMERLEESA